MCCEENPAYLSRIERADERTRTAYPCSSYEFDRVHNSLSYWGGIGGTRTGAHLSCASLVSPNFSLAL